MLQWGHGVAGRDPGHTVLASWWGFLEGAVVAVLGITCFAALLRFPQPYSRKTIVFHLQGYHEMKIN